MTFTNLGDIVTGSPHGLKGLTGVVADTCLAFLPFLEVLGSILQTALLSTILEQPWGCDINHAWNEGFIKKTTTVKREEEGHGAAKDNF